MALCLFLCGHLNGEIGNWSRERYRTNGSLFNCGHLTGEIGNGSREQYWTNGSLFYCGYLSGEIGNWSCERHRTNGPLFDSLWSSHWGNRKLFPWGIQDQWLSVCLIVVISLGKRETGPVSYTGPMTVCLFHCRHLTEEIGNWSRERHRTNCSLLVLLWSSHWGNRKLVPSATRPNGSLFVSMWSSHWGKRKLVPWAILDQWLSSVSVVISLGK